MAIPAATAIRGTRVMKASTGSGPFGIVARTTKPAAASAPAYAIHVSCWRSSPLDRRNRTTSDAAAARMTKRMMNWYAPYTGATALRDSNRTGSRSIGKFAGAEKFTSDVAVARAPTRGTAAAAHATTRHRGEGSFP